MAYEEHVSADRMMNDVRAITRWTRSAGSPEELEAAHYVEAQLRAIGCRATILMHDAYISLPGEASLTVLSPDRRTVPCVTLAMAASTPKAGVEGELVYVPNASAESLAGMAGRIVLVGAKASPETAANVDRAGVAAAIFTSGPVIGEMICSSVWGSPGEQTVSALPKTPMLSVAQVDGESLRTLCAAGPVRVHLRAHVDTRWTTTPIVIGDLAAGHPEADSGKYVLFSGHIDGWHKGAMDNASANAVMLEMMRLFAARRPELRRDLRLAFWSGHSHGRYSGSAWYADNWWFDLEQHCVAHVNIDVVGAVGADLIVTTSMVELGALAGWALQTAAGGTAPVGRMKRTSDESFWGVGVPSMFGEVSRQPDRSFGWWIHTVDDTVDKIDPARLTRDANIYYLALGRLLTDAVVPLDYAATAADIRAHLEGLGKGSGGKFDVAPAVQAAGELETLCRRLNSVGAGAEPGGRVTKAVNACLHDLGRILIAPTYQVSGRFAQDPGSATTFLPTLQPARRLAALEADSDAAKFLMVDLIRARNEVVHALREASGRVERCLAEVQPAG